MRTWKFNSDDFNKYEAYRGDDLGITYKADKVSVKIWAPTCTRAFFRLYREGSGGLPEYEFEMAPDMNGTWIKEIEGNWEGWFYTIQVKDDEGWLLEAPDIYAKATGINGRRGMIFDPSSTNPEGWEYDVNITKLSPVDMVIYEAHIRDFSISSDSGINNKGKYLGFTEAEAMTGKGEYTGLSHLKELGITHVHLLPVADFVTVDEAKDNGQYNWGYDPLNYNTPEGWYATDPYNGAVRIKEFKELVKALHSNGIGVILDVVYNHTGLIFESYFNQAVPGYFYRQREDGSFSDASGCGTEIASEREMARKYIIDSLCYWAKEYHIDGFRFDLMGIYDIDTMNLIREAIDKINPDIFLYGEGWTAAESPLPEDQRAVKNNCSRLNNIAMFSDNMRDSLKGSAFDKYTTGFISGKIYDEEALKFSITGSTNHKQLNYGYIESVDGPWANSPEQCVNYVSSHDNYTLFDKLQYSCPEADKETIKRMAKLAIGIIMTSQGVPFLHAGSELLRSKGGHPDSYRSPDLLNQIKWSLKTKHRDFFDYTRKCIELRKKHPAFRMQTAEDIHKHLIFFGKYIPGVITYELCDNANNDVAERILVLLNGNNYPVEVEIPDDIWYVIAGEGEIYDKAIKFAGSSNIKLSRISMTILIKENL